MGDRGRVVLLGAACVVVAFVLYAGALGRPFFGDDQLAVSGNPTVAQPSGVALRALWVTDYWRGVAPDGRITEMSTDRNLYRPVTTASFWLTSRLAGLDPTAFRAGNVLLHVLAAGLVGLWCVALGWRRGAVVATAFVLVHPVATDVVNRVVGRADVLAVVGIVAVLLLQHGARRGGWTVARAAGAFVATGIALGAKESGIVLLPLALCEAWRAGRPGAAFASDAGRGYRRWLGALAMGGAVALYALGRALAAELPTYDPALTWDLGANPVAGASFGVRLPVAAALAWHYAGLVFLPTALIAFDVPSVVPDWRATETWLGTLVLGVAITALVAALRRRRPVAVGVAWWLLSFVVVSQLLVPIGAYREVRFAYALVAASALLVAWLSERVAVAGGPARAVGVVAVVAALGMATIVVWQRNADYRDLQSLLEADVRQRPASPAALIRLANIYDQQRRDAEAARTFARVIELAPTSAQARYELADFHARRGHTERARTLHEEAVTLNPAHHRSLMALAIMAIDERDFARAEELLGRAVAVAPDDPFVLYNLAVLDDARGQRARAVARLTALVARRPDFSLAVRGLEQIRADEARRGRR